MLHSKFIIEGDNLIMGKCNYHKELATNVDDIKGGGMFRFDEDRGGFLLFGSSFDFGYAKLEDIRACIASGNVYGNSTLTRKIDNHKFFYDTQSEILTLN